MIAAMSPAIKSAPGRVGGVQPRTARPTTNRKSPATIPKGRATPKKLQSPRHKKKPSTARAPPPKSSSRKAVRSRAPVMKPDQAGVHQHVEGLVVAAVGRGVAALDVGQLRLVELVVGHLHGLRAVPDQE